MKTKLFAFGALAVAAAVAGLLFGPGLFRQGAAEPQVLRSHHTDPSSVVATSSVVFEGVFVAQSRRRGPNTKDGAAGAGTTIEREVITRRFVVTHVLRGKGLTPGEEVLMVWPSSTRFRTPGGPDHVLRAGDDARLRKGQTYVVFAEWLDGADGVIHLGSSATPGLATLSGDTLDFVVTTGYKDELESIGLPRKLPQAFVGLTVPRLMELIAADDIERARVASLPEVGLVESPRGKALEQLANEAPSFATRDEALARVKSLGLDAEALKDPPFCRKVEAIVRTFGKVTVDLGCG